MLEEVISKVSTNTVSSQDLLNTLIGILQRQRCAFEELLTISELVQSKHRIAALIKEETKTCMVDTSLKNSLHIDTNDHQFVEPSQISAPGEALGLKDQQSTNLNEEVTSQEMDKKEKMQVKLCHLCLLKTDRFDSILKRTSSHAIGPNGKRLIKRMNRYQKKILQQEFIRDPNWSQEKVIALASRLKIPKSKVYKWNWDQKNKARDAFFAISLQKEQI